MHSCSTGRMAGTRSGYRRTISLAPEDVDFVDKPPKLQIECPICFGLLDTPHILSCCGWHFCDACIRPVIEESKPCPMCKGEFDSFVDKSLLREMNQLEVRCPNKPSDDKKGCLWVGELGTVESHLNPVERFGECLFASVGCIYGCGHRDIRCKLETHESTQCPKRPYSCDYCNDYESTCEDVTERHWKVCDMYVVPCPNECEQRYLYRKKLSQHLAEECELAEVLCPFAWAGCTAKIRRCNLTSHIESECSNHLTMVCSAATVTQKQVNQLSKLVNEISEARSEVKEEMRVLQREREEERARIDELTNTVSLLTCRIHQLEEDTAFLRQQSAASVARVASIESGIGVPPFSFVVSDFERKRARSEDWLSPPFYSHLHGYRMCIRVSPNGLVIGEGTHISLTVHLMKGLFDDHLNWPFRGNIHVALCNQEQDNSHHVETISFHKKASEKASGRAKVDVMNMVGLVSYEFLDHAFLKPDAKRGIRYLLNDSLQFRVLDVTVDCI